MPAAITDLEQLKERPEVARLLAWHPESIEAAKFDRNELGIVVPGAAIRDVCALLRDDRELQYNFLSDITCVDWYPSEPRFEIVYSLLSIPRKQRLRLKARLPGDNPSLPSLISVWPSCNYFEREIFDLFGVRFEGHPYLRRIMMPEDWKGHPLRKDYPVEGYR
jgi:NADH-quinone oxidoreductase subunit C